MGIPSNVKELDNSGSYKFYDAKRRKSSFLLGFEYEIDHIKFSKGELEILKEDSDYVFNDNFKRNLLRKVEKDFPDFKLTFDGSHNERSEKYGRFHSIGLEFRSPVGPLSANNFWADELIPYAEKQNPEFNGIHNNGGIHVNIQRNAFTEKAAPKVFKFIHSITNWKFIHAISKRGVGPNPPAGRWAYAGRKDSFLYPNHLVNDKYSLITAHKTYAFEIRLFGAHPTVLKPAIEFAHACFIMSSNLTDVEVITVKSFVKWISTRRRYVNLYNFIIENVDSKIIE